MSGYVTFTRKQYFVSNVYNKNTRTDSIIYEFKTLAIFKQNVYIERW